MKRIDIILELSTVFDHGGSNRSGFIPRKGRKTSKIVKSHDFLLESRLLAPTVTNFRILKA